MDANKVETSILSSKDNVNPEDDAYVASVSATNQSIARDKANRDRIAREKADRERLAKSSSQAEKPDFENFVVS